MSIRSRVLTLATAILTITWLSTTAGAAPQCHHAPCSCPHANCGHGCAGARTPAGPPGQPRSGADARDMELFHFLADHRADIDRSVKMTPTGVETLAESDDPDVAEALRSHVVAMSARLAARNPIHRRDPLFAEIFAHSDKITVTHESTARGIRVVETSEDPYVVKLIQAHADVVTLFIENGRSELMKNHDVPAR